MIVEFALSLALTLPEDAVPVTQVEFVPPITRVVTYPPVGTVHRHSGLALPEGTREAFEDEFLRGQVFFGAFAIAKDFSYGYVTGANSRAGAQDIAMQECLKASSRCLIYAEILPQDYVDLSPGQVSLTSEVANYHTNPDPAWGSYRAMAISEDGAYSIVWNHGTLAEARAAAVSDCSQHLITDLPGLRPMPCVAVPFK